MQSTLRNHDEQRIRAAAGDRYQRGKSHVPFNYVGLDN